MAKITPFSERFWRHVQKTETCWIWTATLDKDGYGSIRAGGQGSARLRAHRASYLIHFGETPEGMFVCHHCDNPSCVRPEHLFLGTQADNERDKDAKGRRPRGDEAWPHLHPERLARGGKNGAHTKPEKRPKGEAHGNAVLTEDSVSQIRKMYATGTWRLVDIAAQFGVCIATVHVVVRRKAWTHVA